MSDPLFESLIEEFLLEARERIDRVETVLLGLDSAAKERRAEMRNEARRELHTLKGNAAMMGLTGLQATAHRLEDQVETLDLARVEVTELLLGIDSFRLQLDGVSGSGKDEAKQAETEAAVAEADHLSETVRIPYPALDTLVEELQEVVIFRNRLNDALDRGRLAAAPAEAETWEEARTAGEALHRTLDRLQDDLMKLRLVPLKTLFRHLQRLVHDESRSEEKQVRLETRGGNTPMDKGLLEVANDALGHLVRNAVVHGIEAPAVRAAHGKPAQGSIFLSAEVEGEEVRIEVRDDGAGIDTEALRRAARERGIELAASESVESLVFAPGLSTKAQADLSAGRGMGLSAVVQSVERQSGRVDVFSKSGEGSRFVLRLPMRVSVTQALLLRSDGQDYALPFATVVESRPYEPRDLHRVNHSHLLRWREQFIPLIDLGCFFRTASALREVGEVVVVEVAGQPRALLTDAVLASREIVVKGLDGIVGNPPGVSGSTIMGDGRVILILDPARIGGAS